MATHNHLTVNGERREIQSAPDVPLIYVLRDELGLNTPKFGCGLSQCGACSVLADGQELRACSTPVGQVLDKQVWTLEGLAKMWSSERGLSEPALHPVQQAWIDEQVPQCGYCQAGMIVQAVDLLKKNPHPSDGQIREAMNGHLCRCSTYPAVLRAVKRAARNLA